MLLPHLQLKWAKQLMIYAAEIAVKCTFTTDIDDVPAQLILARRAGRAVWRNDQWLAEPEMRASSEAAAAIEIHEGQVKSPPLRFFGAGRNGFAIMRAGYCSYPGGSC